MWSVRSVVKVKSNVRLRREDGLHVNIRVADQTSRRVDTATVSVLGRSAKVMADLYSNGSVKPKTPLQLITVS